jgi:hypothetical protein
MGNIIWLASYPRSGNIWLQAFLYNLICDAQTTPGAAALAGFCTAENAALHFMAGDSRPLGDWSREEVAARRAGAQRAIAGLRSDNVFASTHAALVMNYDAPTIAMEETAAAIYLVRNPLDIAVSLAADGGTSIDEAIIRMEAEHETENSNRFAYECQGSWSTNVMSWTQQNHAGLHLLRYEDLLATPEQAFGPLATFLGFDSSPERVDRAIRLAAFANLSVEAEKSPDGAKLLRAGRAEQWRDALSAEQADRIVRRHARQMERFGYIPEGH